MKKLTKRILYVSSGLTALCWSSAIFAQTTAAKVAETASSELVVRNSAGKETLFEMIMLGGWVMIPLGLCSLVTLTLLLEREIMLRKVKVIPDTFWPGLKEILQGGKNNLDKAFEYCVKSQTPIGDVIKVGIEKWKKDRKPQDVEKGVEDAASREVSKMARTLRGFKIVAGISPLLGLLGTVYGMIKTFQIVAAASESLGQDKAAKLAAGIYQAMVTTAAGLTIAIPTLLIYYYLNRRVDAFADDIEVVCTEFIDEYQEANK
jgi:biopolymer transport protein ExbB